MPIYAYKCTACGFARDEMLRIADAPLTVCPSCGQAAYAKQLSAAGFQLKGSGWYATDFKGGSKPAEKTEAVEPAAAAATPPDATAPAAPALGAK